MNDKHSLSRISRQVGIAIILVAMLVRGFVCFRDVQQYAADPDAYRTIAETLTNTGVFGVTSASGTPSATAYRPPLYPYVLSLLVLDGELSLYAIAALHTIEEGGLRTTLINAVEVGTNRSKELGEMMIKNFSNH